MSQIAYYILVGLLLFGMVAMLVVQGRKQKKAQSDYMEMLDSLRVGTKVKLRSGLLGRIKEIREEAPEFRTVVIDAGTPKNPVYMTFTIDAVEGIVNEERIAQLQMQKVANETSEKAKEPEPAKEGDGDKAETVTIDDEKSEPHKTKKHK